MIILRMKKMEKDSLCLVYDMINTNYVIVRKSPNIHILV